MCVCVRACESVTELDSKIYKTFLGSGQSRLRKLRWPNVGVLRIKQCKHTQVYNARALHSVFVFASPPSHFISRSDLVPSFLQNQSVPL